MVTLAHSQKTSPDSDREELRTLLRQAFVYPSADNPLVTNRGLPASYLFYPWTVTLASRGLALAARCLVERLGDFDATQLANAGNAGTPLVAACVPASGGRYDGLFLRDDRKGYGSRRRIDGPGDRKRRVVVLDDTIASGFSLERAIAMLEEEGFVVEGALSLVGYANRGASRLQAAGYRVEWLFDFDTEIQSPSHARPPAFRASLPERWADERIPDGLHAALVARRAAEAFLARGEVLQPPRTLDAPADGRGGTFVSFRERTSDLRVHRDGFWHFVPSDVDPCRDVVLAAVKTVQSSGGRISASNLSEMKIAVSFLGPLEQTEPRDLDFATRGIVVRNPATGVLGGALPNTQYYVNDLQQYAHARLANARTVIDEPHDLFTHTLEKRVEPGESWLVFGFPEERASDWTRRADIGEALTRRARAWLVSAAGGSPPEGTALGPDLLPEPAYGVAVTLYARGVTAQGIAFDGPLDECLRTAARDAFADASRAGEPPPVDRIDLVVSVLYAREWLGEAPPSEAAARMRLGLDALVVSRGEHHAIVLPSVPVFADWSKEETARQLVYKAGITRSDHCAFALLPTASWLARADRVRRLRFAFPDRTEEPFAPAEWRTTASLLAEFLHRHRRVDEFPVHAYRPREDETVEHGPVEGSMLATLALHEAGRILGDANHCAAAGRTLSAAVQRLERNAAGEISLRVPGDEAGLYGDALLLVTVATIDQDRGALLADERVRALATGLRALVRADGRIVERPDGRGLAIDHDRLPGLVLLGLARFAAATGERAWVENLGTSLRYYRRRFELVHPWGMVGWQPQALEVIHRLTGDSEAAALAIEIGSWAAGWQHVKSGAFLSEYDSTGFSSLAASFAEGVVASWRLADRTGDSRAAGLARCAEEALRFCEQLVLRDDDVYAFPDPEASRGGVRPSPNGCEVRIDQVGHLLLALLGAVEQRERS